MKKLYSLLLFCALLAFFASAAEPTALTAFPETRMITIPLSPSVTLPTGAPIGIVGDKGAIAAKIDTARVLTDAERADVADIGYGVSAIGVSEFGKANAVQNLVNGHWGGSYMANLIFDGKTYDVGGSATEDGKYRALITLNFGETQVFDAIGFFSGNSEGCPQAADVYVSEDGAHWTLVPSACYDGINSTAYVNLGETPKDPYNGNVSAYSMLLDMDGAVGKYVRLGVCVGRRIPTQITDL